MHFLLDGFSRPGLLHVRRVSKVALARKMSRNGKIFDNYICCAGNSHANLQRLYSRCNEKSFGEFARAVTSVQSAARARRLVNSLVLSCCHCKSCARDFGATVSLRACAECLSKLRGVSLLCFVEVFLFSYFKCRIAVILVTMINGTEDVESKP